MALRVGSDRACHDTMRVMTGNIMTAPPASATTISKQIPPVQPSSCLLIAVKPYPDRGGAEASRGVHNAPARLGNGASRPSRRFLHPWPGLLARAFCSLPRPTVRTTLLGWQPRIALQVSPRAPVRWSVPDPRRRPCEFIFTAADGTPLVPVVTRLGVDSLGVMDLNDPELPQARDGGAPCDYVWAVSVLADASMYEQAANARFRAGRGP